MGSNGLARKSQNMTECVPVPTSEHVAEIVGRQGKNNIYILCPELHFQEFMNSSGLMCFYYQFHKSNFRIILELKKSFCL